MKKRPSNKKKLGGSTGSQQDTVKQEKPDVKVYIYLQLKKIENLPERYHDFELKLRYGDKQIQRLDIECTPCSLNKLNEGNITFSFPVIQDSIECLNAVSDNPVIILLYERKRCANESGGDEEELEECAEEVNLIGQGYIDILRYFQRKRFSTIVDTFIYPTNQIDRVNSSTTKATWQLYTLLPLLKDLNYSNIVFLSFESMYNCPEDLMNDPEDLVADIILRELKAKVRGKPDENEICNFSGFTRSIIANQKTNFIWQSARDTDGSDQLTTGIQADCKVNTFRLFKHLLCPEGKLVDFGEISTENDEALVCNSMHRFILTDELRALLEEVFVFRQQELVLRIFRKDSPDIILLEGVLEPSVLLYPLVNAVRFAVVLTAAERSQSPNSKKRQKKESVTDSSPTQQGPIFAIISMCLLTPITDSCEILSKKCNISLEKVNTCRRKTLSEALTDIDILKERSYDSFDEWVHGVVNYIIVNNVRDFNDANELFCSESQNASNKILPLIALDFNQRIPTKNNIEFCNMMTIVYKELENRAYRAIGDCSQRNIKDCYTDELKVQECIITLMNRMKLAQESKDEWLKSIFLKELREKYSKNVDFNYFMFLNDVEMGNFESAKEYISRSPREKKQKDDYFIQIADIYMEYMESLQSEENASDALENLLIRLTEFTKYYKKDNPVWILLYCLYKASEYLPGMEYARWHFESTTNSSERVLKNIPKPRWNFYLSCEPKFSSYREIEFYKAMSVFQSIGAYKFAEIIFIEIEKKCNNETEQYLQKTTMDILLGQENFNDRRHSTGYSDMESFDKEVYADVKHTTGHVFYAGGDETAAMAYYEYLIDLECESKAMEPYILGLRRYTNYMISNEAYDMSLKALLKLNQVNKSLHVSVMLGKTYYKLENLEESLECFKKCTEYNLYFPDVWAYLALIHLRMGQNYQALECWKQARLYPNLEISKEIIDELNKINIDDLDLYVDISH